MDLTHPDLQSAQNHGPYAFRFEHRDHYSGYFEGPGKSRDSNAGSAILAVEREFQSQFRYCLWYRSSSGIDFDNSEKAMLVMSVGAAFSMAEAVRRDGRSLQFVAEAPS